MENRIKWIKHPHWLLMPVLGCVMFVILTAIGMVFYPGGTFLDANTIGYRFWENYFSDLGRTVARNGDSNEISNICFVIATICSGGFLLPYFLAIQDFFQNLPRPKRLARISAVIAVPMSIGYILVGIGPADTMRLLHYGAMFFALILTIITTICLSGAIWQTNQFPHRYITFFALIVILICFFIWSQTWGPRDTTIFGLHWQVTAQKITIYGELILMAVQGLGAYRLTVKPK